MKLSLFQKIKLKKALRYSALLILLALSAGAIATNFLGKQNGSWAAGSLSMCTGPVPISIIEQGDTTYDNRSIRIPATYSGTGDAALNNTPCVATIDGEHTFDNVTVENGGTLTTTDWNRYGFYPEHDRSSGLDKLANGSSERYVFIMRGFINTGTNHTRTIMPVSGDIGEEKTSPPDDHRSDDASSLDFFPAVALPSPGQVSLYDETLWTTPIGHSFTGLWSGTETYTDGNPSNDPALTGVVSTDSKPLIPFELKHYNHIGRNSFGIAGCNGTASVCTWGRVFNYFDTLGSNDNYDAATTTGQLKTFVAWQSSEPSLTTGVSTNISTYANFNNEINRYRNGLDWDDNFFVKAPDYDFRNDRKQIAQIKPDGTSSYVYLTDAEMDETNYSGGIRRNSHYRANGWNVTPLALEVAAGTYPVLSESVIPSLNTKKLPTVINVPDGTFHVENGGKVNVSGKGYSSGWGGSGPGKPIPVPIPSANEPTFSGAAHSGLGGLMSGGTSGWDYTTFPARPISEHNTYDKSNVIEPILPGSGGRPQEANSGYEGYGGGFIKIAAKMVQLENGSMVVANGVRGAVYDEWGGGSGGSIIISDNDNRSTYDGLISAQGAPAPTNWIVGGGGGGYISINTGNVIAAAVVQSRYEIDKSKYLYHEYGLASDGVAQYTGSGFLQNAISVNGGRTGNGNDGIDWRPTYWGKEGIFKVTSSATSKPTLSIKKTLTPHRRNDKVFGFPNAGDNYFNPYALQPDDVIIVNLLVKDLVPGAVIKDEVLKQASAATGYWFCEPIDGTILATPTLAGATLSEASFYDAASSPPVVTWTVNAGSTATEGNFNYHCLVKKR